MGYSATNGNPLAFAITSQTTQGFTANDEILAWTGVTPNSGTIPLDAATSTFFTLVGGHSYYLEATMRASAFNDAADAIGFVWTDTAGGVLDTFTSSFMQPLNAAVTASNNPLARAAIRVGTGTLQVHLRSNTFASGATITVTQASALVRQLD